MNKSFTTLKSNIGTLIQDTSSSMGTNIGVWVNNRYRDIINSYDWEQLYTSMSFTASASVSAYATDENIEKVIFVLDKDNDAYLAEYTEESFLQKRYDIWDTTGDPEIYFLSHDCVVAQASATNKPMIKSSSASDTTQTILLRGISSSMETYESLTVVGSANVTATNSYSKLLGVSKSASTTGLITLMDNGGTTQAVLSPENLESRYKLLNLHFIPDGTYCYQVRGKRRVLPLSQAYDYPIIEGIEDIIELGGVADGWRYKRQFSKAREYEFLYEKAKNDRIHREVARPGMIYQMQPISLNRDDGIL